MTDNHAAGYDFVKLGEGLAKTLLNAAQDQVSRANQILEQTQSLADIIMTQVRAQAIQIEDMNARFKAFGEQMLVAHRVLNGNAPVANPAAPSPEPTGVFAPPHVIRDAHLAQLRARAGVYGRRVYPPESPDDNGDGDPHINITGTKRPDGPLGTAGPGPHPVGVRRTPDSAGYGELHRALAASEPDAYRVNPREDRTNSSPAGGASGTGTDDSRAF